MGLKLAIPNSSRLLYQLCQSGVLKVTIIFEQGALLILSVLDIIACITVCWLPGVGVGCGREERPSSLLAGDVGH